MNANTKPADSPSKAAQYPSIYSPIDWTRDLL